GFRYLRTTRGSTPVIYSPDESFEIGGSKVVRESDADQALVVSAGITLHEALKAADTLADEGLSVRVVDCYSIKPIDAAGLRAAAKAAGNKVLTVEDHWPEGGLGDAVLEVFADTDEHTRVVKLAVRDMPTSGKPDELVAAAGLDAGHIADAARKLAGS
ncbi:MAG TPA: transketolase C-terminal domain-containing protein, partial [Acidimicrobiales bacterium]|nr:transketolase C-terminal domain-containing protein [Acidimicrobiales bacterium]